MFNTIARKLAEVGLSTYTNSPGRQKESLFPNNYPRFALGTLDALVVIDGAEKVNQLLEYQMEAKIAMCLDDIEGKSLSEKN